ncbi:unnamed protein product [Didymodactylos carnosus]|uniref:Uncharacterized protein n=1 Tax=Didymodactylos carnosus TaxID=1234261 RepID=A0A816BV04_9BILA|nr:unnamed protein product [Didymodactylos carnosus]CAF4497797.1 unnamed protein product [Didymodactylos carnosus]
MDNKTYSTSMGTLLNLDILLEIIKRPIPVLIGFIAQFGLMPLIALAITKIFKYNALFGLGLFVVGCCPDK